MGEPGFLFQNTKWCFEISCCVQVTVQTSTDIHLTGTPKIQAAMSKPEKLEAGAPLYLDELPKPSSADIYIMIHHFQGQSSYTHSGIHNSFRDDKNTYFMNSVYFKQYQGVKPHRKPNSYLILYFKGSPRMQLTHL